MHLLSRFDHALNAALRAPQARHSGVGVYEADHAWILRTDLAGFSSDDLSLHFENEMLSLTAERQNEEHAFHSRIERSFRAPDQIDPEGISARLENGVLEITLPKLDPGTSGPLEIKVD